MKKKLYLLLIVLVAFSFTQNVYAAPNTLSGLRKELTDLKNQRTNAQNNKRQTEKEINSTKNDIKNKQYTIATNQDKITSAMQESVALENDIKEGKEKLAKLLELYQISEGNNKYLEYVFKASSYEELVYRYAVVEEIMEYQNDEITSWKEKIAYNEQLKKDLEAQEIQLNNQIDSLNTSLKSIGNRLNEIVEETQDIEAEIKSIQEQIKFYENLNCKENEDLNACLSVNGDKIFLRPTVTGKVVSEYGYRLHPTKHVWKLHSGTDIYIKEGSNVYSIANGTVGKIVREADCGGNKVYVYHMVNGKKWTSCYMHLLRINVKIGDKVTSNTVVGLSGGKSTAIQNGGYDECTTGQHLHLSLATGWYQKDKNYNSYSSWISHLVNPRKTLDLPKSWSSRR